MTDEMKIPKKLIEVALPLDDINAAAQREKSIRHGHPSTLHLWWARRPLAAARAVLFAQLVNDPGYQRDLGFGVNKKEAEIKREKLFQIIRSLVQWKNTNNEDVLNEAREAIRESWRETCHLNRNHPRAKELFNPDKLPAFHDPFAGGGTIPLEAQRLGLESYASDLNPVAVMINKAMIEIPPRFAGRKPTGPLPESDKHSGSYADNWPGASGLAEDVRRYGHLMREEAFKRIGHLYPKVKITAEMAADRPDLKEGEDLTVIAWLWARTVKSPSPAFSHVDVPLITSYVLSSKKGSEAYVQPVIEGDRYRFEIRTGPIPPDAKSGTKIRRGGNFQCLISQVPIPVTEIRRQGQAGTLRQRLMAVVAEGNPNRIYINPTREMEAIAESANPIWRPETEISHNPRDIRTYLYGINKYSDLFTVRQLMALTTFSDLVREVRDKVISDAKVAGLKGGDDGFDAGGDGATAYGDAIAVYLAFSVDKSADYWSSICSWGPSRESIQHTFSRQAIPMTWDYAEANPFSNSTGNASSGVEWAVKVLTLYPASSIGIADQADASTQEISTGKMISTDPPYYDNIGYADLSDFFYVWMRHSLREIFPSLFSTMAVPKASELVATPYRHGSKDKANSFFLEGMTKAIRNIAKLGHPAFPVSIYYAFKQSETKDSETVSQGWETFLDAIISAGFSIDGTWPMRTEMSSRMVGLDANALASSVVLVCKRRLGSAEVISRRDLQRQLRAEMPEALETMIGGSTGRTPIAPVDLAQSAIGPGMAIFSKYEAVLNQDGSKMSVHDALILINRSITEYLSPESGNFDSETQFCSGWFDQHGWSAGPFGEADTLSRAKGTSVDGIGESGILESGGGKVRLLKWNEYEISSNKMIIHFTPPPPPLGKRATL